MKRFLAFKGYLHYPDKGWRDFFGDFDTLEDAKTALLNVDCEWWQVIDTAVARNNRHILCEGSRSGK
jgi:hypothetical protein